MARFIVKLHEHYFEYSTIVDAPVTMGMSRAEFDEYYQDVYGTNGMRDLPERMERVEAKGTSAHGDKDAADTLFLNRAGPDETELTVDEIYQAYCLMQPVRGWIRGDSGRWEKVSE
jgi:hypothetical protein